MYINIYVFGARKTAVPYKTTIYAIFSEKNDVDLGVNITGELEGLKKNLDAYKVNMFFIGDFLEVNKVKMFFIGDF